MAVPIGLNRLLAYLETGGEGAVVKPWVWILWLGLGPISKTVFWELYLFLSVRACPLRHRSALTARDRRAR